MATAFSSSTKLSAQFAASVNSLALAIYAVRVKLTGIDRANAPELLLGGDHVDSFTNILPRGLR